MIFSLTAKIFCSGGIYNDGDETLKERLKEATKEKEGLLKEKEHLTGNCEKYKEDLNKEAAFRCFFCGLTDS